LRIQVATETAACGKCYKIFNISTAVSHAHLLLFFLQTRNIPKEILSSTAREEHHTAISEQKKEWLQKQNIDYNETNSDRAAGRVVK
jgi:hypothetical protein